MPVFFYSVQPLKGQLGFEEIDAIKTSCTISSISSAIWARFKSMKHATSTRIWTWSIIQPKCSMFWRVRQRNIIKAVDRIGHFRVPLCLCFKASPSVKSFLWKWLWFAWDWNCMQNSFSYERFCTWTRFETEAQENSEMAYLPALKIWMRTPQTRQKFVTTKFVLRFCRDNSSFVR